LDEIPISVLFGILVVLILLSAFFSGSETGLMTLDRYRLRHLARAKHPGAIRAERLLEKPDRLIGLILLGNNFVNILASAISTIIALRLMGQAGIAVATGLLTLVILIFAEVAPKTLAALHPERIAFPAVYVYQPLLKLLYPVVRLVNGAANGVLKLLRIRPEDSTGLTLSREELRTVVAEAGAMIPRRHQNMLLNLLDLEQATVEDIMVPRNEIVGVDLNDSIQQIANQITHSQYTRLPVFEGSIDNVVGFIHVRRALPMLKQDSFGHDELRNILREPLYIAEGTSLNRQLLNFQRKRRRIGLVVDEYGDIQGLATLEDILEEIVGEFTTDPAENIKDFVPQPDGSYVVDGSANVRELNRALRMELPTNGPKTLNGLILEYLETIPEPGTSLLLSGYPVEIVQIKDNAVRTVRMNPATRIKPPEREDE